MNQFTPKNINNNPNSVRGDLQVSGDLIVAENTLIEGNTRINANLTVYGEVIRIDDGVLDGRTQIPLVSIITVPINTNYEVLVTDRIIKVSTTIAGTRTITLGDLADSIIQITILLTAMNTGVYEINTTLQGTITLSSANEICTVLHIGDGVWTLLNFT